MPEGQDPLEQQPENQKREPADAAHTPPERIETAAAAANLPAGTPSAETPRDDQQAEAPSTRRTDPWAHRRGEPRLFALAWAIYLFAATATIFFAAMAGPSISTEVMRPAAQLLLIMAAAGISILWPMVRLSQVPDPNPISGTMQDLLVIMIPVQAVIWPQSLWWLARWPFATVVALACTFAAWGVLIGGMLAYAQAQRQRPTVAAASSGPAAPLFGSLWTMTFLGLAFGGILVAMALGVGLPMLGAAMHPRGDGAVAATVALMLSPLGAALELTRDTTWTGRSTPLTAIHWVCVGGVAALGAAAWIAASVRGQRRGIGLRFQLDTP
jgi:hypothetical protein